MWPIWQMRMWRPCSIYSPDMPQSTCNLGTGIGHSVREVISAARSVTDRKVPHSFGARRPGDPPELVAHPQRALDVLRISLPHSADINQIIGDAWSWHLGACLPAWLQDRAAYSFIIRTTSIDTSASRARAIDRSPAVLSNCWPRCFRAASPGIDLRDFVALLRQNVLWLVLAVFVGASLGVAASLILPKRYPAEGQLVIDTREINIPEFESLRSARTFEPWGGRSEAQVLASRELISAVATKLDLQHDPHFNPTLRDGPVLRWVSGITWIPDSWREELRQAPEFGPRIQTGIVKQIASTLKVMSEEKSYAINVRYTSYDPLLSANFVNALMQYYLDQDVRAKRGVVDQARAQLKERLEYLQSDLAETWARIRSLEGQPTALETQLGRQCPANGGHRAAASRGG